MTNRTIAITAAALAAGMGAALAQNDGTSFSALDTDKSGGVSMAELKAAGATVTAEAFARHDADGSGELSASEFAAWRGAQQ